jgi:hypothetical protein
VNVPPIAAPPTKLKAASVDARSIDREKVTVTVGFSATPLEPFAGRTETIAGAMGAGPAGGGGASSAGGASGGAFSGAAGEGALAVSLAAGGVLACDPAPSEPGSSDEPLQAAKSTIIDPQITERVFIACSFRSFRREESQTASQCAIYESPEKSEGERLRAPCTHTVEACLHDDARDHRKKRT